MLKPKIREATRKILLFSLKELHCALLLDVVQKVIRTPEIHRSGDRLLGVVHVEAQEVVVVDVYQRIYGQPALQAKSYLIILAIHDRLYGITVPTLPVMREIPATAFQSLPADYRDRDPLGIASHTAEMHEGDKAIAVFLLDTNRLLEIVDGRE